MGLQYVLIGLTSGQLFQLRSISHSTGTPVSHFVRQAVDELLSKQARCSIVVDGIIASGSVLVVQVGGQ